MANLGPGLMSDIMGVEWRTASLFIRKIQADSDRGLSPDARRKAYLDFTGKRAFEQMRLIAGICHRRAGWYGVNGSDVVGVVVDRGWRLRERDAEKYSRLGNNTSPESWFFNMCASRARWTAYRLKYEQGLFVPIADCLSSDERDIYESVELSIPPSQETELMRKEAMRLLSRAA